MSSLKTISAWLHITAGGGGGGVILKQHGHTIYQRNGNSMLNTMVNDLELLELYPLIMKCLQS